MLKVAATAICLCQFGAGALGQTPPPPPPVVVNNPATNLPTGLGDARTARLISEQINKQLREFSRAARVLSSATPAAKAAFPTLAEQSQQVNAAVQATSGAKGWLAGVPVNEPDKLKVIEETVRWASRPVWVICNGQAWFPKDASDDFAQIVSKIKDLKKLALATGIIVTYDVDGGRKRGQVGTGVAIGSRLVLTNKHVVTKGYIGYEDVATRTWKPYTTVRAQLSFPLEYERCAGGPRASVTVNVIGIEAVHPTLDLAILRTAEEVPAAVVFPRAADFVGGDRVGVVGYPTRPGDKDTFLSPVQIDVVFSAPDARVPFPAARLAAGALLDKNSSTGFFSYDATTWGGSSGSLVVNMTTGAIIGLHARGLSENTQGAGYNEGVLTDDVAKFVAAHGDPN